MHLSPHSTCTTRVWDHCHLMFSFCNNSFLTGLQNLQNPIYLDRLIFLKHHFHHDFVLFHHLPWLPFSTRSKPLLGLQGSPGSAQLYFSPVPHTLFLFSSSVLSHNQGGVFLPPSIYSMPSPLPGSPSLSFQFLSVLLNPFPS